MADGEKGHLKHNVASYLTRVETEISGRTKFKCCNYCVSRTELDFAMIMRCMKSLEFQNGGEKGKEIGWQ